jgi:hypothetical protein
MSTSSLAPYPPATWSTLEALYRLGLHVCEEIENFHPDIVLRLAHSGWMPVVVAQTLWVETRQTPFPPATRTNIGLEKHEIYHTRFGKSSPAFCCGECSNYAGRLGHYLAWLSEQKAWLTTLRRQIHSIFPSDPQRILVVDDIFGGYRSGYATLALLDMLYPQAEAYVYAGRHDLTDDLVTGWLTEFVPPLAQEISDKDEGPRRVRYASPWQETLKPLINGTEDITPDRLGWKFIDRESAAVQALADRIPSEVALAAPAWAKNLACTYAVQRLKGDIKHDDVAEPHEDEVHLVSISQLSLEPEMRLAARAWKQGGVTREDITQVYGHRLDDIKRGLRAVRDPSDWQRQGERKTARYFPTEAVESWINVYAPPDYYKPDILVRGFAEFLPGEVWAGAYPALMSNWDDLALFTDLLKTGVTRFIDLTNPHDHYRNFPYRDALRQASQSLAGTVEVQSFPLPFRTAPDRRRVQRIVSAITRLLQSKQRIYLHAGYPLEGRAPLILACLLITRGYSPKKALARVNAFWLKTLPFLVCSPLSEAQQQFVLEW